MPSAPASTAIVVVGAGAIGGWIAARLALAGKDVALVARGESLRRIERQGVRLVEEDERHTISLPVTDEPKRLGETDILILAVKATALADAAEAAAPFIGPRTVVVPMVNGVPWWLTRDGPLRSVDPDGRIAAALPAGQIIGSVVHAAVSRMAPGEIRVRKADRLILGEAGGGTSDRVARLCRLFEGAGIRCDESADIRRAIWYKLWGNATINPLSALTRCTADRLLADPALCRLMLDAMKELAEVGAAIGCAIEESGEDRMEVTRRLGAFKPSMLQDVEEGRPIELEALVGAPIEIARRAGIETPKLDLIYAMTRMMVDRSS